MCKEKKESIKSNTIWLYNFGKALHSKDLIDKDQKDRYEDRLRSLEECCNLSETYK